MAKAKPTDRKEEIAYLNVDVDVLSDKPLNVLVQALRRKIELHYVGREGRHYSAHFSLSSYKFSRNPDVAVRMLAKHLSTLPAPALRLWANARQRIFNIGFQSGDEPRMREYTIGLKALKAAARVGAALTVTIYRTCSLASHRGQT